MSSIKTFELKNLRNFNNVRPWPFKNSAMVVGHGPRLRNPDIE